MIMDHLTKAGSRRFAVQTISDQQQCFKTLHVTFWLIMIHLHSTFVCKSISNSEETVWTNPNLQIWLFKTFYKGWKKRVGRGLSNKAILKITTSERFQFFVLFLLLFILFDEATNTDTHPQLAHPSSNTGT